MLLFFLGDRVLGYYLLVLILLGARFILGGRALALQIIRQIIAILRKIFDYLIDKLNNLEIYKRQKSIHFIRVVLTRNLILRHLATNV